MVGECIVNRQPTRNTTGIATRKDGGVMTNFILPTTSEIFGKKLPNKLKVLNVQVRGQTVYDSSVDDFEVSLISGVFILWDKGSIILSKLNHCRLMSGMRLNDFLPMQEVAVGSKHFWSKPTKTRRRKIVEGNWSGVFVPAVNHRNQSAKARETSLQMPASTVKPQAVMEYSYKPALFLGDVPAAWCGEEE